MNRLAYLAAGTFLVSTLGAVPAAAQHGAGEHVVLAREKFRDASKLAGEGRWAEAVSSYLEAQRLFPSPTTLLNLGYCYEQLEDFANAYRYTTSALALADASTRPLDAERERQARAALTVLEARISIVSLETDAETQLLRVDDESLVAGSAGGEQLLFKSSEPPGTTWPARGARLVLSAGRHTLWLRTRSAEVARELTLREGERLALTVHAPAPPPPSPFVAPKRTPVAVPATPAAEATASQSSGRPLRQASNVSLLVAGGAALLGAGAGIVAWSSKRELDQTCTDTGACPATADAARKRFAAAATVANVGFAAAAVATAAGLTLRLVVDEPVTTRASVSLRITSDRAALTARF